MVFDAALLRRAATGPVAVLPAEANVLVETLAVDEAYTATLDTLSSTDA
jgi:hypothetical protein